MMIMPASILILLGFFLCFSYQDNKLHPASDAPEEQQETLRKWLEKGREKEGGQKALNCATCEVVVTVMQYDMFRAKKINETVLIEKNKKKVQIPYGESRVAVIDCLEGICLYNDELRVWRTDFENMNFYRLNWTGYGQHLGDNIYGMITACKELVEKYDEKIADVLYSDVDNAVPRICTKIAKVCPKNYNFRDLRWFLNETSSETPSNEEGVQQKPEL